MNEPELPGLGAALGFALIGLPLLVVALRRAMRVLPQRAAPFYRWPRGAAFLVFATPFLLVALVRAFAPDDPAREPDTLTVLLASQLVLGGAGVLAIALVARQPLGRASLGLTAPPARAPGSVVLVYFPGFLCGITLQALWTPVCRARGWETEQEVVRQIVTLEHGELVAAALVAVFLGPLIEELLFRGFLQGFLEPHLGLRGALVVTSAVFASLHGMAGLPILFVLSLFLGWLQQRTRSLWVPWFAHALNNAVKLGLALAAAPS